MVDGMNLGMGQFSHRDGTEQIHFGNEEVGLLMTPKIVPRRQKWPNRRFLRYLGASFWGLGGMVNSRSCPVLEGRG